MGFNSVFKGLMEFLSRLEPFSLFKHTRNTVLPSQLILNYYNFVGCDKKLIEYL